MKILAGIECIHPARRPCTRSGRCDQDAAQIPLGTPHRGGATKTSRRITVTYRVVVRSVHTHGRQPTVCPVFRQLTPSSVGVLHGSPAILGATAGEPCRWVKTDRKKLGDRNG